MCEKTPITPMAHASTFASGETFTSGSHNMFGTLDFLATATGDLRLTTPDMPITTGTQLTRSTRSKVEKRCLKRHVVALKRHVNKRGDAIKKKAVRALSLTLVAGHQPTFVLDLLEDDSNHNSTRADSGADEALERAYFMATPPWNDNGMGTMSPPSRLSNINANARRASLLMRTPSGSSKRSSTLMFTSSIEFTMT